MDYRDAESGLWLKLRVSQTVKGDKVLSILLPALMCINSYTLYLINSIRMDFEVLLYCLDPLCQWYSRRIGRTDSIMYNVHNFQHQSTSIIFFIVMLSLFYGTLSPSSVWSLNIGACRLAETRMCAQTKTNLWENTFDSYCPTFSHRGCSLPSFSPLQSSPY